MFKVTNQSEILESILQLQNELENFDDEDNSRLSAELENSRSATKNYEDILNDYKMQKVKNMKMSDREFTKTLTMEQYQKEMRVYEQIFPKMYNFEENEIEQLPSKDVTNDENVVLDEDDNDGGIDMDDQNELVRYTASYPNEIDEENSFDFPTYSTKDNSNNQLVPYVTKNPNVHETKYFQNIGKDLTPKNMKKMKFTIPKSKQKPRIHIKKSEYQVKEAKPKKNIAIDSGKILETEAEQIIDVDSEKIIEPEEYATNSAHSLNVHKYGNAEDKTDNRKRSSNPLTDKLVDIKPKKGRQALGSHHTKPKCTLVSSMDENSIPVSVIYKNNILDENISSITTIPDLITSHPRQHNPEIGSSSFVSIQELNMAHSSMTPQPQTSTQNIANCVAEFNDVLKEVSEKNEQQCAKESKFKIISNEKLPANSWQKLLSAQQFLELDMTECNQLIQNDPTFDDSNNFNIIDLLDQMQIDMENKVAPLETQQLISELEADIVKNMKTYQPELIQMDESANLDSELFDKSQQNRVPQQPMAKISLNSLHFCAIRNADNKIIDFIPISVSKCNIDNIPNKFSKNLVLLCQICLDFNKYIIRRTNFLCEKLSQKITCGTLAVQEEAQNIKNLLNLLQDIHRTISQRTLKLVTCKDLLNASTYLIQHVCSQNRQIYDLINAELQLLMNLSTLLQQN